mgnify:CR=1 FL=1
MSRKQIAAYNKMPKKDRGLLKNVPRENLHGLSDTLDELAGACQAF